MEGQRMRATVRYKEVGKPHYGQTTYIGKNLTRRFIVDFFGLNMSDVEDYDIKIENA